jgi:hypothetical protein
LLEFELPLPLPLPPKLKKRKGLDMPALLPPLLLEFVGDVVVVVVVAAEASVEDDCPLVVVADEGACDGNGKNLKSMSDELFV